MFQKVTYTKKYCTRLTTKENFYAQHTRTRNMRRSVSRSGIQIWNSLPLSIKVLNETKYKSESNKMLSKSLKLKMIILVCQIKQCVLKFKC